MRLIQKLWRFVTALADWLADAWRVWAPFLVVVLVLTVASRLSLSLADAVLRYCGLAFQLLGILTVVSGLRDKRRLFNRPSLVENVRRWMNRRPRWGAKPQTVSVVGTGGMLIAVILAERVEELK